MNSKCFLSHSLCIPPKNVLHVLHFFVNNLLFTYLIKKTPNKPTKKPPQVCQVSFCMWNLLFEWCLEPDEIIKRRLEAIDVLVIFTISAQQQQLVLIEALQLFFRVSVQGNFNSSKMHKYHIIAIECQLSDASR